MAMLYMSKPLPLSDLDLWVEPGSKKSILPVLLPGSILTICRQRDDALAVLSRLHIVTITAPTRDDPHNVSLTLKLRHSLRLALTGGGDHQSFGAPSSTVAGDVDLDFLDEYARSQWEGILHYVVSSVGNGKGPTG